MGTFELFFDRHFEFAPLVANGQGLCVWSELTVSFQHVIWEGDTQTVVYVTVIVYLV